jgi:hypothetical protein
MVQKSIKYEAPEMTIFDLDLQCVKGELDSEPGTPGSGGFGEADDPNQPPEL